jgi:hypothetical protein
LDFFFMVLGFELRASCLLLQALYGVSHAPSPFALVTFEIGSCFLPKPAWTMTLLFGWVTGTWHHTQPLVEMGFHGLFAQADFDP